MPRTDAAVSARSTMSAASAGLTGCQDLLPGLAALPEAAATAGVDEAGRGCLAGPVVAAAVILPEDASLPGLADSKTLSERQRDALAPLIRRTALAWGLGMVWPRRIETINILQATFEAMSRAVSSLGRHGPLPELLLIDGNKTLPPEQLRSALARAGYTPPNLPRQRAVVHGDATEAAISAASILAKTQRDKLMTALDRRWPVYGFARHKGYGTADHYAALRAHGPCPLHRLTFRGVLPEAPAAQTERTAVQGSLL